MIRNMYIPNGDGTMSLLITRRNGQSFSFLLDDESFELICRYQWSVNTRYEGVVYALTSERINGKRCNLSLHRIIARAPKGSAVDHVSGNTLDNRLVNLRLATTAENVQNQRTNRRNNTTGFKGVRLMGGLSRKYIAQIGFNGKDQHLGVFETAEEAADAYNLAAIRLHGAFARLNTAQFLSD
jgi:hypothetical protein